MLDPSTKIKELVSLVANQAKTDGVHTTTCAEVTVARSSLPLPRIPVPYSSSICFVFQGQKHVYLGGETYIYDPSKYLVVPMAMPLELSITNATPEKPLLAMAVELDLSILSDLLVTFKAPKTAELSTFPVLFVSDITDLLQDALIRLLKLLGNSEDLQILGKSIIREIMYWVLKGEQGIRLQQLMLRDSSSHRIISSIQYLNNNFQEQLSIDQIASVANMSSSSLHQKFKEVTSMTPIQYLKKIRLHRARELMVDSGITASDAGYKVGYSNPSQFGREFKRLFGLPPTQLLNAG